MSDFGAFSMRSHFLGPQWANPILSIMIPTLKGREVELTNLVSEIEAQFVQVKQLPLRIQIISAEDKVKAQTTAGPKRNFLMGMADGIYGWFIDDDDMIPPGALAAVLDACKQGPDVIGLVGTITALNGQSRRFEHFLEHKEYRTNGEVYERFPNHISPMKLDLMRQIQFEDKYPEDTPWAHKMRDSGLLKTQVKIEQPIYIYRSRMTHF